MTFYEYYDDPNYSHVPNVINPTKETVAHCHSVLVLDPYGGCVHKCKFCYVTMGLARIHNQNFSEIIPMRIKMPEKFEGFLKKYNKLKYPIRISSNCDPFQPVEKWKQITHKMLNLCLDYNYPIIINTKGQIPLNTQALIEKLNEKSLIQVQISFFSLNPEIVHILEPNVSLEHRILMVQNFIEKNIPVSIRFQPIIPRINSSKTEMDKMLDWCKSSSVSHIIVSFLRIKKNELENLYLDFLNAGLITASTFEDVVDSNFWDDDGLLFTSKLGI